MMNEKLLHRIKIKNDKNEHFIISISYRIFVSDSMMVRGQKKEDRNLIHSKWGFDITQLLEITQSLGLEFLIVIVFDVHSDQTEASERKETADFLYLQLSTTQWEPGGFGV